MKSSLGWCGLLLLAGMLLPGCDGSVTNSDSQLNGNFSGLYYNHAVVVTMTTNSGTAGNVTVTTNSATVTGLLVTTNSGPPVTLLNLTQSKSQLYAVDNRSDVFTGTFSIVYANGGMVQMRGLTGGGIPVQITGYLEASGSNAWISAEWIEPNLNGVVSGSTTVAPFSPTNPAVWKQ